MTLYRKTRMGCSCGYQYPGDSRRRLCPECGSPRKPKRRAKHLAALELGRDVFIEANGGVDACGICGAIKKPGGRALHRDHDHRSGRPRGVLCFRCNASLRPYMTREWLEAAVAYMARGEDVAA